jgi:hypothetical protein
MELNEPITLGGELQFCEVGNQFALAFLAESRDVLKIAVLESNTTLLQTRVISKLNALLRHTDRCPDCNKD